MSPGGRFGFLCVFAFVAVVGAGGQPPPENEPLAATLPEIVVTASRRDMAVFDAPYATDVFRFDYITHRKMPRTVPEILGEDPMVMVQKTGHGQGAPFLRGFTGFRTLFLIDGIRLNNSVFRDGPNQYWNTVDALSLERLEMVRGPGSVLYGSDAIGGTVNAITRGREEFPDGFHWSRRLYTRFASAEDSAIGRAEISGNLDQRLGLLMGVSLKRFGELEGGQDIGTHPKTDYHERDCDLKLVYRLDEHRTVTFAHQRVTLDDAWRTHKTIHGISWHGTTVGDELARILDQERDLTYLRYEADGLDGFIQSMKLTASYHVQEEERFRRRTGDRIDRQGFEVRTLGLDAQFSSATPIGLLTYGVEWYHDDVDTFKRKLNPDGTIQSVAIQGPVGDDATYDLVGLYLQDEIAITERLDAILGVRYTWAKADADRVEDPETGEVVGVEDDWDTVVGSARLVYRATEHWNVWGGVSQGFRAPNLSDLTRLDTARSGEIETPSPGLDPEQFCTAELGVKARYPRTRLELTGYCTRIRDMIVRFPTGDIVDDDREVQKANVGDGYVTGIEARARHQVTDTVSVFAAAAWTRGEVDTFPTSAQIESREPMSRIPPLTGLLGVRWEHPSRQFWAETVVRMADEQDRLSPRDEGDTQRIPPGGTPGYGVWDIRVGARVTADLHVSAACENVLDKDYRIHGSGVNEPGRNFILAADWTF
ncbi:MAG: TonB-dependent receptor plug domain-containing protein [Planctomycetota bacterium]